MPLRGWEETLVWLASMFCCTKFALFLSVPVFSNLGRNWSYCIFWGCWFSCQEGIAVRLCSAPFSSPLTRAQCNCPETMNWGKKKKNTERFASCLVLWLVWGGFFPSGLLKYPWSRFLAFFSNKMGWELAWGFFDKFLYKKKKILMKSLCSGN